MAGLEILTTIGSLATAAAVIVALVFGIVQVRLQAAQRRDLAAAEILRQMLTRDFLDALDMVLQLPDDAPAESIQKDVAMRRAIRQVDFALETAGSLVHDRVVPLHQLDRIMGGVARASWRKARAYTIAERARIGSPNEGEWWQWLVERMDEDPAPGKAEGAHVAFADWER